MLALCGMGEDEEIFDLRYFNGLSLKLMPLVLGLIQEHGDYRIGLASAEQLEKDALSRLFHTLRGWQLPWLFDNLHLRSEVEVQSGKSVFNMLANHSQFWTKR